MLQVRPWLAATVSRAQLKVLPNSPASRELLPRQSHGVVSGHAHSRFVLFVLLLFMQFTFKKIIVSVNELSGNKAHYCC